MRALTGSKKILLLLLAFFCVTVANSFAGTSETNSAETTKGDLAGKDAVMKTISGTLKQVSAIGGETTGWAIQLDEDLEVSNGKKVKQIEVDPKGKDITALDKKRVQAKGALEWRHGIERGDYPVFAIDSIQAIKGK